MPVSWCAPSYTTEYAAAGSRFLGRIPLTVPNSPMRVGLRRWDCVGGTIRVFALSPGLRCARRRQFGRMKRSNWANGNPTRAKSRAVGGVGGAEIADGAH